MVSYQETMRHRSLFEYDGKESEVIPEPEVKQEVKEGVSEEEGAERFEKEWVYLKTEKMSFEKKKALLRQYFKQLKVGMIVWSDVPREYQVLLMKYYGVGFEDVKYVRVSNKSEGDEDGKENEE